MTPAATNLSFTKFLFVVPRRDDDAVGTRLRAAGGIIARGFFNDYDADGTKDAQPQETIQFLVAEGPHLEDSGIGAASYVVQVTGRYRPRLLEIEQELRRRLGDAGEVLALDGAVRPPRYTSADMFEYAYRNAVPRRSGRVARNAVILPISKTREWWDKPTLERHAYFYPHIDASSGCPVHGHAQAAQDGIPTIHRRLYHNPDGYGRPGEFDFITYFECEDEHLETFERIHAALRDTARNPEWRYVKEGPLWRGRRVLRW
jgi:hypothetical protein